MNSVIKLPCYIGHTGQVVKALYTALKKRRERLKTVQGVTNGNK